MLTTMGAPELVTRNLDDYYRIALELATGPDRYAAVRRSIMANRDTSPLFDSTRYTRNLEQCYLHMLEGRAGQATLRLSQPRRT